ncbi:hypothetical protein V5O48_013388 [Marasmius crinis-equi]|uniref:GRF-type domain-containing protein n=1 Tax=Marasmius crinis-equi TaxID=585013 RepID=A0ABR3F0L7_9AGAR
MAFSLATSTVRCCICPGGPLAEKRVSYTEKNWGREFWGCRKTQSHGGCDFFMWAGPPPGPPPATPSIVQPTYLELPQTPSTSKRPAESQKTETETETPSKRLKLSEESSQGGSSTSSQTLSASSSLGSPIQISKGGKGKAVVRDAESDEEQSVLSSEEYNLMLEYRNKWHCELDKVIRFKHQRLRDDSDSKSFRLVKIEPWTSDFLLRCSVEEVDLQTKPVYDALSYTWFIDGDLGPPTKGTMQTIVCNGMALDIHQNLYDALLQLRALDRGHPYWIDAICIDQEFDSEKSSQVNMMGEIFSGAETVIVWLGKGSLITSMAIRFTRALFHDSLDRVRAEFSETLGSYFSPTIGLKVIMAVARVGACLLSLPWIIGRGFFERVWTLQEVVLAKRLVFFIGNQQIPLENFANNCSYIDLEPMLEKNTQSMFGQIPLQLRGLKFAFAIRQRFLEGQLCALEKAVAEIRIRKTSKPSDKVFSILSITLADSKDPNLQRLRADYRKKVDKVYCECAMQLLMGQTGLFLLSLVGQLRDEASEHIAYPAVSTAYMTQGVTFVPGLPSWVPDLSAPPRPIPFRDLKQTTFFDTPFPSVEVSFSVPDWKEYFAYSGESPPSLRLNLKVATIGVIKEKGDWVDTKFNLVPWRFLEVPVSLGKTYRPTGEPVIRAFQETLVAGELAAADFHYRTEWGNTAVIDESRFTEWFVAMVEDTPFYGPYVGQYILQDHDMEFSPEESHVDPFEGKGHYTVVENRARGKHKLNAIRHFLDMFDGPQYNLRQKIKERDGGRRAQRGYHVRSALRLDLRPEVRIRPPYMQLFDRFYLHRCLFTTRNGFMGTGPWTVQEGDVVMFVAGGYVPYIFRPSSKEPGCWELVGEAYCHGLMRSNEQGVIEPRGLDYLGEVKFETIAVI